MAWKMKDGFGVLLMALLAALGGLFGCVSEGEDPPYAGTGTAVITLKRPEAASRAQSAALRSVLPEAARSGASKTLFPTDIDDWKYTLEFSSEAGTHAPMGFTSGTIELSGLAAGTWTITAIAKAKDGTEMAIGSFTAPIAEGAETSFPITLAPKTRQRPYGILPLQDYLSLRGRRDADGYIARGWHD